MLFDTVYETWAELPEDDRPKLIIYGLSLGSFGAEAAYAGADRGNSVANMTARTDGVLLGGPTNDNVVLRQITDDRETGTPVWRPVYEGGETVRVLQRRRRARPARSRLGGAARSYVQHAPTR